MRAIEGLIYAAGVGQLCIAAANVFLPARLRYRENLGRVDLIIRQIFIVHHLYIVLVLLFFATLCFLFAPELAGGNRLGRFLSVFMALFWLLRVPVQLFYYDVRLRRQERLLDALMVFALVSVGGVFAAAAALGGRP